MYPISFIFSSTRIFWKAEKFSGICSSVRRTRCLGRTHFIKIIQVVTEINVILNVNCFCVLVTASNVSLFLAGVKCCSSSKLPMCVPNTGCWEQIRPVVQQEFPFRHLRLSSMRHWFVSSSHSARDLNPHELNLSGKCNKAGLAGACQERFCV